MQFGVSTKRLRLAQVVDSFAACCVTGQRRRHRSWPTFGRHLRRRIALCFVSIQRSLGRIYSVNWSSEMTGWIVDVRVLAQTENGSLRSVSGVIECGCVTYGHCANHLAVGD